MLNLVLVLLGLNFSQAQDTNLDDYKDIKEIELHCLCVSYNPENMAGYGSINALRVKKHINDQVVSPTIEPPYSIVAGINEFFVTPEGAKGCVENSKGNYQSSCPEAYASAEEMCMKETENEPNYTSEIVRCYEPVVYK